jgi:hypothetical protein
MVSTFMKKRTIEDIDIEIDELDDKIDDIKESISEDEPEWREGHRRKTGDLAPGYVPLADRRKKVERLERKRARLVKERAALVAKQVPSSGKRFGHGERQKKVLELAERDGFAVGDTVRSKRIAKWVRELRKEGFVVDEKTIRAALSKLEITKERRTKD